MKIFFYSVVSLIAVSVMALGIRQNDISLQDTVYQIGDTVSEFSLNDIYGSRLSLTQTIGSEGVILIFTCNTCPYAKLYEERILEIEDIYGDAGYPVLLINPNDPVLKPSDGAEALISWVEENTFSSPYLVDNKGLYLTFGIEKTPEVVLLDANQRLRYRGGIDDSVQGAETVTAKYLEDAIRAIRSGQDPNPTETRPIGCSIKSYD